MICSLLSLCEICHWSSPRRNILQPAVAVLVLQSVYHGHHQVTIAPHLILLHVLLGDSLHANFWMDNRIEERVMVMSSFYYKPRFIFFWSLCNFAILWDFSFTQLKYINFYLRMGIEKNRVLNQGLESWSDEDINSILTLAYIFFLNIPYIALFSNPTTDTNVTPQWVSQSWDRVYVQYLVLYCSILRYSWASQNHPWFRLLKVESVTSDLSHSCSFSFFRFWPPLMLFMEEQLTRTLIWLLMTRDHSQADCVALTGSVRCEVFGPPVTTRALLWHPPHPSPPTLIYLDY